MSEAAPDFTAMLAAVETARVSDLIRYVERRLRERPDYREMEFGLAWPLMVGSYAAMAATPVESLRPDEQAEPF